MRAGENERLAVSSSNKEDVRNSGGVDVEKESWTHWDLNPGPSACGADVIPLHHVPGRLRTCCDERCNENRVAS